jgi:hypothetical protein
MSSHQVFHATLTAASMPRHRAFHPCVPVKRFVQRHCRLCFPHDLERYPPVALIHKSPSKDEESTRGIGFLRDEDRPKLERLRTAFRVPAVAPTPRYAESGKMKRAFRVPAVAPIPRYNVFMPSLAEASHSTSIPPQITPKLQTSKLPRSAHFITASVSAPPFRLYYPQSTIS